mmetsp:Transcript_47897/g.159639  ORF Transcript_47897/g.159639 Transcript_47897/m.159639 type:complete len:276 (+) Transcript_47897:90-917(+)
MMLLALVALLLAAPFLAARPPSGVCGSAGASPPAATRPTHTQRGEATLSPTPTGRSRRPTPPPAPPPRPPRRTPAVSRAAPPPATRRQCRGRGVPPRGPAPAAGERQPGWSRVAAEARSARAHARVCVCVRARTSPVASAARAPPWRTRKRLWHAVPRLTRRAAGGSGAGLRSRGPGRLPAPPHGSSPPRRHRSRTAGPRRRGRQAGRQAAPRAAPARPGHPRAIPLGGRESAELDRRCLPLDRRCLLLAPLILRHPHPCLAPNPCAPPCDATAP